MSSEVPSSSLRRSKSRSRPTDYIQSGSRFTRAKNKKIVRTIKTSLTREADLCKVLDSDSRPISSKTSNSNKDLNNLVKHYEEEFLRNPTYSYVTMGMRDAPDKPTLMRIYKKVTENGGFKEVTASSAWDKLHEQLDLGSNVNLFELYKKYLFHYEKIFNEETKLQLNYKDDGVTIEDLDPNCLIPVKVFVIKKPSDLNEEVIREALKQDVWVIRNFEKATGFNKKLFEPEHFIKEHPNDTIDIVTQDPEVKTFHRTKNDKEGMRLADYLKYQKQMQVKDENGFIKFGVNIDIGNWKPQINELVAKIPEEVLLSSWSPPICEATHLGHDSTANVRQGERILDWRPWRKSAVQGYKPEPRPWLIRMELRRSKIQC